MAKIAKTTKMAALTNGKGAKKVVVPAMDRVRVITPVGILLYPHLVEPNSKGKYANDKYQVDILFSKDTWKEEGRNLREEVLKAGRLFLGKPKATLDDFANPFKDGDDKNSEVFHGFINMTPKSQFKPTVVGPDKSEFSDERIRLIKSGDFVRLVLSVYSYTQGEGGITCGLEIVQFAKEGTAIGGGRGAALELLDEMEVDLEDPTDEDSEEEETEEDEEENDDDEDESIVV